MITEPFSRILQVINQHELLSLLVLIGLEEGGVPLPVPGDIFIMNAGRHTAGGLGHFFRVLMVVILATALGTSILYWIARKLGRGLVFKYLRFLHIRQENLKKVEKWFQTHGGVVIILGRLTPGLRIVTTLVAGFFKLPYYIFIFYTVIATIVWVPIYFFLGQFLGRNFFPLFKFLFREHPYISYPFIIVLAIFLLRYFYRRLSANSSFLSQK